MAEDIETTIRRRIRSALDSTPVEAPPLGPVMRRGRRRRTLARTMTGIAVVIIALGVVLPLRALVGTERPSTPTATSSGTYLLSDFRVEYPYVDPATGRTDRSRALLMLHSSWSGDVYPGEAQCMVRLTDAGGGVVGRLQFGFDTMTPSENVQHRRGGLQVPVTAAAVAATGSCGPGERPRDGYRFSHLRIVQSPYPALAGRVEWTTTEPPLTNVCTATFELPNGGLKGVHFTLSVGNRSPLHIRISRGLLKDEVVGVTCAPYTRPGEYPPVIPRSSTATPTAASSATGER